MIKGHFMFIRILIIPLLLLSPYAVAQDNFTISPQKPQAGDTVHFTYKPSKINSSSLEPIEGIVYQLGSNSRRADDLSFVMESLGNYSGYFTIDSTTSFIYLSIKSGKKYDNNNNDGYTIIVYKNGKPTQTAFYNMAIFYQLLSRRAGVEPSNHKAIDAMQKEFDLYPESRTKYLIDFVRLKVKSNKTEELNIIQEETEALLKAGIKTENDYTNLENLYLLVNQTELKDSITKLKKEKYPDGEWEVTEFLSRFESEKSIEKMESQLAEFESKTETVPKWKGYKHELSAMRLKFAFKCLSEQEWNKLIEISEKGWISNKSQLAALYNDAATSLLEQNGNMQLAEMFAEVAANYYQDLWKKPESLKPNELTQRQWENDRKAWYAIYGNTYAMVLYKIGKYEKGYPYSKDAAIIINNRKDPVLNTTYTLLAQKILPVDQFLKEVEEFVIMGNSTNEIKGVLKEEYIKRNRTEAGFDQYMTSLENKAMNTLHEHLRKAMTKEKAPMFSLRDLEGKIVRMDELKGKVVILDFWATWCKPCKESFPAMQKIINRYKDNPNVTFYFIDTWERGDKREKEKEVAVYIKTNRYDFSVLFDSENTVVSQFKVSGLPTKYVIDKEGFIRFRSFGYRGSDEDLIAELDEMIKLVQN